MRASVQPPSQIFSLGAHDARRLRRNKGFKAMSTPKISRQNSFNASLTLCGQGFINDLRTHRLDWGKLDPSAPAS